MVQIFTASDDIQWVRDVHWKDLPKDVRAVVLYGNEDAPAEIVGWVTVMPKVCDAPAYVWSKRGK